MAVTAAQVKELREITGVGMMDCKKALQETNGDIDAAVDWLRTRGLAKAAKKASRVASEGLIGVASNGNSAAVVEVNSETDFVARNEQFQSIVSTIANLALENDGDFEKVGNTAYPNSSNSVNEEITEAVAKIGENMSFRRSAKLSVSSGVVSSYMHTPIVSGLGKIGVLVALESQGDKEALDNLGRQVAMHIAAIAPLAISPDELDQDLVAREKAVFKEQAIESGKPAEIAEKMVEGRLRKYYKEVCLLSQIFVVDGENTVEKAIELAEKTVGAPIKLIGFTRFALGEGIEKKEEDFAAEVAAVAGK
ncbi:MAG: translation elongation factor Ts [Devosiaceae bacterium]|nr:translation elongation factor Ts [Devosiaceae bacterium]